MQFGHFEVKWKNRICIDFPRWLSNSHDKWEVRYIQLKTWVRDCSLNGFLLSNKNEDFIYKHLISPWLMSCVLVRNSGFVYICPDGWPVILKSSILAMMKVSLPRNGELQLSCLL